MCNISREPGSKAAGDLLSNELGFEDISGGRVHKDRFCFLPFFLFLIGSFLLLFVPLTYLFFPFGSSDSAPFYSSCNPFPWPCRHLREFLLHLSEDLVHEVREVLRLRRDAFRFFIPV
jgi:hypothetical protein